MKIDGNSGLWIVGTSEKWEKGNISHESSKGINILVLTICNLPTMFEDIGCSVGIGIVPPLELVISS